MEENCRSRSTTETPYTGLTTHMIFCRFSQTITLQNQYKPLLFKHLKSFTLANSRQISTGLGGEYGEFYTLHLPINNSMVNVFVKA